MRGAKRPSEPRAPGVTQATLSLASARRIALAAQGFADPRPAGRVDRRHLRRVLDSTGLLQIDSVNVLVRAHYLPLFSRLGPYARELVDRAAWSRPGSLFEYWAHEASLLPVEMHPLLRWRMERAARLEGIYRGLIRFHRRRRKFIESIFDEVARRGPTAASDFAGQKGEGGWWGWSDTKIALEWLFWAGRITTSTRRGFERLYDIPERVIPAPILALPTPDPADAQRALMRMAARSLGVATAGDLRDYYRLPLADAKARLAELVEAGELVPVRVEGWSQQAYLHAQARCPRRVEAHALLAPFDPLVWERSRAERLFDFRYRIEIYTPAHKRVYGYYVLPFLMGDRLAARIDLKADRQAGALRVIAAYGEKHADRETAAALAAELQAMATWLGLESVVVHRGGDLTPALRKALPGKRRSLRAPRSAAADRESTLGRGARRATGARQESSRK